MPRRLSLPRSDKRGRRRPKLSRIERAEKAIYLLSQRVEKLEGRQKRIGFTTCACEGDRVEQDDGDYDYTPDEVP